MITEYPLEHQRYDQPEYELFSTAAAALDLPLSLHTATRRQGKIHRAGPGTLRDASSRATKAFYPALSLCDLIFSGVFERHPAAGWRSSSSSGSHRRRGDAYSNAWRSCRPATTSIARSGLVAARNSLTSGSIGLRSVS
jgi:hypothetical protein